MATAQDAELVLKLYDLRREETMRKARAFLAFQLWPESAAQLAAIRNAMGTEQNGYWRQVMSYWEMAASFVLRGAVDADLFLDSAGEGIFLYAKFQRFHVEAEGGGARFMPQTAKLIEEYPAAKAIYEGTLGRMAAREKAGKPDAGD